MCCEHHPTIYTSNESEENTMNNYPLKASKYNWRSLEPQNTYYSEKYIADHFDLYLTSEYIPDNHGNTRRYYRLHARNPHTVEMALAYDIKCPCCGGNVLKQVGRCNDHYTLGLYECPVCDRK